MVKNILTVLLLNFSILISHPVVKNLDLDKFMGRWYVFSLIPNWIESGATNSYDDYSLNDDGSISITYQAIKNNKERTVKQKGFVIDKDILSRWEIQFVKPWVPFYKAPYEVIILDENYEYMVVGYPDNSFGWIMTRSTTMDSLLYDNILNTLEKDFNYDKNNFEKVLHSKR
mgnify:CR=1 FL=1